MDRYGIVKDYLERFPTMPSKALAKKICKENQSAWKDIESVRSVLQFYRSHLNNQARRNIIRKKDEDTTTLP